MRLIDVDALKEVMVRTLERIKRNPKMDGQERHIISAIVALSEMINDAQTVDAVPVVRCKDCKFVGTDATCCLVCEREGMGLRPFHVYHEDFCSRGERKDGDGK